MVSKRRFAGALGYAALLALSRLVVLVFLGWAVGGLEFTSDVTTHMYLARHPLELLSGHTQTYGQYPPLLPLLEALLALPLSILAGDFYALRVAYILFEAGAAFFFHRTISMLVSDVRMRRAGLVTFFILPMGWMTTVVMAQDEVISELFLLLILWLHALRKPGAAILVCSLAVASAKVFFVLPLIGMIWLSRQPGVRSRLLSGILPCGLVYGLTGVLALNGHEPLPLLGFAPRPYFGVNLWVGLVEGGYVSRVPARLISTAMALVGGLFPLLLVRMRRLTLSTDLLALVCASSFLWFLTLFYHVNPEYYVLATSGLLLVRQGRRDVLTVALLGTMPWLTNFFSGVHRAILAGDTEGGRAVFVAFYRRWLPLDPLLMYQVAIFGTIFITLFAAVSASRRIVGGECVEVSASADGQSGG